MQCICKYMALSSLAAGLLFIALGNDSMPPISCSKEETIAFWDTNSRIVHVCPGSF